MKLISYSQFEKILLELFSTMDDIYDRNNYQSDDSYNNVIPVIKKLFRDYFPYHQNIKNLSLRLYRYSTEYYNELYSGLRTLNISDESLTPDNCTISYKCCLLLFNEYIIKIISPLVINSSSSDIKYMNKNIKNCKPLQGYLNFDSGSLINLLNVVDLFREDDYIFIEEVTKILRLKKCESRYLPMIITTT